MSYLATDKWLAEHAEKIRELGKKALRDIIEIGRHLTEVKRFIGHGAWLPWLRAEFGWSEMTATRFMRIYDFENEFKSHKLLDLSLNLSALYELTRRRTPPEVVTQFLAKAERGEKITAREIRQEANSVVRFPNPPRPTSPIGETPYLEVTIHEITLPAFCYPVSSSPLIQPPPPPDVDDGSISWIERRLQNRLESARVGYNPEEFHDFLETAHQRCGSDEAFAAWLEAHGVEVADAVTLEERSLIAIARARRKARKDRKSSATAARG